MVWKSAPTPVSPSWSQPLPGWPRTARIQPANLPLTPSLVGALEQPWLKAQSANETDAWFRLFAENSQDLVWVLDLDAGRPVYASQAWERMTGMPLTTLFEDPRKAHELVHPGDREQLASHLRHCRDAAEGERLEVEFRIVREDGQTRWLHQRSIAVPHPATGHVRICGIACDVTERKTMEANLREREARLAMSERMASLGTLAAGVGHEINNPLTYLMCNLEMAQRTLQALTTEAPRNDQLKRTHEQIRVALEGSARIRDIVSELRAFSRAESEEIGAVDGPTCLEAALNIALHQVRHRARIVKKLDPVPPVRANEVRLGQVLLNLIVNAAQAMPEGQAHRNTLTLAVSYDAQRREALFEVTDTGTGISPDHLTRIFDPFFTTKSCGEGTGLGLFLAQQAVQSYGGSISVESQLGQGSTFRVRLPCQLPARRAPAFKSDFPAPAERRAKVLVIDDEREVSAAVAAMLENEHDVTTADHGHQALQLLAGTHFDMVLCDLMMPTMSASEFFDELGRVAPSQLSNVCFMTGGIFTDTARGFLERAKRPLLNKPFTLSALRSMVAQCMAARR